jgi:serine-type D-Ala-D-Ala carboxypeptidase/endopeptidase (penicillin-binding protein 4)
MGMVRGVLARSVVVWLGGMLAWAGCATAQPVVSAARGGSAPLPGSVIAALQRAGIGLDSVAIRVEDLGHPDRPLLSHREMLPMNPASVMKLVTTLAALDLLGPDFRWTTPVWLDGPVQQGLLEGNLVIKGGGDPQLVQERLWLLLQRVQGLGVREIAGDIVLDRSAWAADDAAAAEFDGEGHRAYNVRANALLLNYRTSIYSFVPDPARGTVQVLVEPPLAGRAPLPTLQGVTGPCGDWRAGLRMGLGTAQAPASFSGSYPLACGEQRWALADPEPASFDARLLEALWKGMGGALRGRVRDGMAPATKPAFEVRSPALAEVLRDLNKFSNNVMAQQVFLTLAANGGTPTATPQAARERTLQWLAPMAGGALDGSVVDNGSGLSRSNRLSAMLLARLLQAAAASPWQADFYASLPLWGIDGTLRRQSGAARGRARLKTGSLRDVSAIAGDVLADDGRRYALVMLVNHAAANQAWPAFSALVQWVQAHPSAPR